MDEKRFTLRMDAKLFEEISKLAADHRRSVAKEIECAIAKYVYTTEFEDIKLRTEFGQISHDQGTEELKKLVDLIDKINPGR